MFSLESLHRGDSNEYTQHVVINTKKRITLNYPTYYNVCTYGIFSLGTQERDRNNRGKRAMGVRTIEVLLYLEGKTTSLTPKIFHESRVCFQLLLQSCPVHKVSTSPNMQVRV